MESQSICAAILLTCSLLLGLSACALPPNYEAEKHQHEDAATGSMLPPDQNTENLQGQIPQSAIVHAGGNHQ